MQDIFKLSDDWKDIKEQELILFGMGRIGRRVLPTLKKEYKIPFVIDNSNIEKEVYGIKVLQLSEALQYIQTKRCKLVVTTMNHSYDIISKELSELGFKEYEDYCLFERFVLEWNYRWNNKCVLSKIDTVITSRCTLNCENCNIFIPYVNNCDIDLEELKDNFDTFFDSVDFVYEYTLLGGEPFLHSSFKEIIEYLEKMYSQKIGCINIISNGTIVPNPDVITLLKKYKITVHISDYTNVVNYKKKLEKLKKILDENKITYYVIPNNIWKDVKFPKEDFYVDNIKEHMQLCGHSTHSVGAGKLYWCDPAYAAEHFVGFESQCDDYLDLKNNKKENVKMVASLNIIRYLLGTVNMRGYMSICSKCAGIGRDNNCIVQAGKQFRKE